MAEAPEFFALVTTDGVPIGCATRAACHRNPALLHRVVHVLVRDDAGRIYLQKRSARKDIQPGMWDTSVGGHAQPGEAAEQAARRELQEELGVTAPVALHWCHDYVWHSDVEREYVTTYACIYTGALRLLPEEIDEGRWWTAAELAGHADKLTPNCREELRRMAAQTTT